MARRGGPADGFEQENLFRLPLSVALESRTGEYITVNGVGIGPSSDAFGKDPVIIDGYVEKHQDGRTMVVKRPGRTLARELNLSVTNTLMGLFFYHGRGLASSLDTNNPAHSFVLAVAYDSSLFILNPENGTTITSFTGLFPNGMDANIITVDVEPVYFEEINLPDLNRTVEFPTGKYTSSPPLEGFFMNSARDAYFYNSRVQSLTKIVSPNYPYRVVGGAAWLNGRFYVMTDEGRIYASGINDPFTWNALDFISAIMHPDRGVAIKRQHTYLMAMGSSSTEWFYDSGAAIGNPLRRVDSAAHDFGCLNAGSLVKIGDVTIFIGYYERTREVGVYVLDGYVPKKISSPFIDRLISANAYDCVWAYPLYHNGHRFYVFNVCCINFSIVYDLDSNWWYLWSSRFVDFLTSPGLTAAVASSGLVEVTVTSSSSHFAIVGTPLVVSGATQSSYNGNFVAHRILSSTSLTYMLETSTLPVTPATGTIVVKTLTGDGGSEWNTAASATSHTAGTSFPLTFVFLLDRRQGNVYKLDSNAKTDDVGVIAYTNDTFINHLIRLPRWDSGNVLRKFISRAELVGDKTDVKALVRYSDDDYQTWSPYRQVSMNLGRSRLSRQGSTRRRAYEVRQPYDNANRVFRLEALELFTKQGSNV